MKVSAKLQPWGNSYGLRISKKTARRLRLHKDETLIIDISPAEEDGFGIWPDLPSFEREEEDREW